MDAQNLVDDLRAISSIVDPVVAAIGDLVADYFPYSFDRDAFDNQLRHALEGGAIPEIEQIADRVADDAAERSADTRGWDRASDLGVD